MTDQDLYLKVTDAIRKLAKKVRPENSEISLFGSRARGDFRQDSDWDIHILVPGPEKLSLQAISDYSFPFLLLGNELDIEINPVVHSFDGWKKRWFLPFYKEVEKDRIKL